MKTTKIGAAAVAIIAALALTAGSCQASGGGQPAVEQEQEVCHGHMHDHEWVDMDPNGFVVACSEQTQEKTS